MMLIYCLSQVMCHICSNYGPLHMPSAMDKFDWGLPYRSYFGGVCAFTKNQFLRINGFTNTYWGWGGEDDEAEYRVYYSRQTVQRLPYAVGKYSMIKHGKDVMNRINPERYEILRQTWKTWKFDGLNTLEYEVLYITNHKLFTEIVVDLLPDG